MIRQICPHCNKLVELPEGTGGGTVPCPLCQASIVLPSAYAPGVAAGGGLVTTVPAPVPPPGLNPAALEPPVNRPAELPVVTNPSACCAITLNPRWLDWIPAVAITFIVLLTFFAWVGSYPGGVRVYAQNPWFALVGAVDTSPLPDSLLEDEKKIEALMTGNRWLIVYLPLLLFTLLLVWLERFVHQPNAATLPGPVAWLPTIWPRRFVILGGVTVLLFGLLWVQTWRGFGLENAIRAKIDDQFKEYEADTTPRKQKLMVEKGRELARYELVSTTPLNLALWAHAIAAIGSMARLWVHRRGAKPFPRLVLEC